MEVLLAREDENVQGDELKVRLVLQSDRGRHEYYKGSKPTFVAGMSLKNQDQPVRLSPMKLDKIILFLTGVEDSRTRVNPDYVGD